MNKELNTKVYLYETPGANPLCLTVNQIDREAETYVFHCANGQVITEQRSNVIVISHNGEFIDRFRDIEESALVIEAAVELTDFVNQHRIGHQIDSLEMLAIVKRSVHALNADITTLEGYGERWMKLAKLIAAKQVKDMV